MWFTDEMSSLCAVRHLMEVACSAAVRGSGANSEYAHHVLSLCHGDVKVRYCLHSASVDALFK